MFVRRAGLLGVSSLLAVQAGCAPATRSQPAPAAAPAEQPAVAAAEAPLKLAPRPTTAAITPADLMTRMYVIADDSMMGRRTGTVGNVKGTNYIAAAAERIGLEPAGENGTYFQNVPVVQVGVNPGSSLTVDGAAVPLWTGFVPLPGSLGIPGLGSTLRGEAVGVVYAGPLGGAPPQFTPAQVRGKLVVIGPPTGPIAPEQMEYWARYGLDRFPAAAGIAVAVLDFLPPAMTEQLRGGGSMELAAGEQGEQAGPVGMFITAEAASQLLGAAPAALQPGAAGKTVRADVVLGQQPTEAPARNVVAVLRGSDPALRGQYVVLGAHNDAIGVVEEAAEHDSLRAFNRLMRPQGAEGEPGRPTASQRAQIQAEVAAARRARPPRPDSTVNGADDDGTGTVALLEIAQALASAPEKPRRSVLFVWHTAEEQGLFGSEYFTDNPTVPLDSMVAQLNIDMIGRGGADDTRGGGPGYLQLIGSRRLSTQLGDLVESVNTRGNHGFDFDYSFDADGHPLSFYCRSDHYNYARYGVPVTFFSTGGHQDYHMITDEPQYIDYEKLARVTRLIGEIAETVANLDARPVVDKPRPDPNVPCVQ